MISNNFPTPPWMQIKGPGERRRLGSTSLLPNIAAGLPETKTAGCERAEAEAKT